MRLVLVTVVKIHILVLWVVASFVWYFFLFVFGATAPSGPAPPHSPVF